jgi:hypothetical protein
LQIVEPEGTAAPECSLAVTPNSFDKVEIVMKFGDSLSSEFDGSSIDVESIAETAV